MNHSPPAQILFDFVICHAAKMLQAAYSPLFLKLAQYGLQWMPCKAPHFVFYAAL